MDNVVLDARMSRFWFRVLQKLLPGSFLLLISGCLGYPGSVQPVADFQLERYLGKWYEIARLDHSFEKGLENVTAEYSLLEDGGVQVINRGFSTQNNRWQEAIGKAYFVDTEDRGYLKVSFFGPFYGSYVIFELADDYQFAFVTSSNTSYLWLLARTPTVSKELLKKFRTTADKHGFETDDLILVQHNQEG
jgi:apolipoprotein D and lipocalin family protein